VLKNLKETFRDHGLPPLMNFNEMLTGLQKVVVLWVPGATTPLCLKPLVRYFRTLLFLKFLFVETYCFHDFSVVTTLVMIGSKDKSPLKEQSDAHSFGLSADPSVLEPGMRY
jgi:hypothetical protein